MLWGGPSEHHELMLLANELSERSWEGVRADRAAELFWWCGQMYLADGERERAESLWRECERLAERLHHSAEFVHVIWAEATRLALDGNLERAILILDQMETRGEELGMSTRGQLMRCFASLVLMCYLGRAKEWLQSLENLSVTLGFDPASLPAGFDLTLAYGLAHSGELEEARRCIGKAVVRVQGERPTFACSVFLEAAVLAGDRAIVKALYEELLPAAGQPTPATYFPCPGRTLGMAAALLGEPDMSRRHFDRALDATGRIRFRPEVALTHLQLAELLLAYYPDERDVANNHLDSAIAEFRDMKMQPYLERALRHKDVLKA
jgi:tetratricopeptide (TPR) repeat protein